VATEGASAAVGAWRRLGSFMRALDSSAGGIPNREPREESVARGEQAREVGLVRLEVESVLLRKVVRRDLNPDAEVSGPVRRVDANRDVRPRRRRAQNCAG
jgi:hypothetical protein